MSREAKRIQQRALILSEAARLISEEGLQALSMRRLATCVNMSTQVLYTQFGSKRGLLDALLAQGFERFALALRRAKGETPWDRVRSQALAYRAFAQAHPDSYRLMWPAVPWAPSETEDYERATLHGEQALYGLTLAITELLAERGEAASLVHSRVMSTWSCLHGFVTLEMSGKYAPPLDAEAEFDALLEYMARALGAV